MSFLRRRLMTNIFATPEKASRKYRLFDIGVEALERDGWTVDRVPGIGKSSVRKVSRRGKERLVSIRTSQDTWIAFPRNAADDGWSTLELVDAVVAVSVDDKDRPTFVRAHSIKGDDMRARFDRTMPLVSGPAISSRRAGASGFLYTKRKATFR